MKFTAQKLFNIQFHGDDYWMRRALEEAYPASDGVSLDDVRFTSHDAAVAGAKAVLTKYAELTSQTRGSFNSTRDRELAATAFEGDLRDALIEGRFVGEPRVDLSETGMLTLSRATEVRFVGRKKTIKTVVVEGETYTKEGVEETASPWFPGVTEHKSLWVSGGDVVFASSDWDACKARAGVI